MSRVDDAVREYIESIDAEYRPLFDRLHNLILEVRPDVTVVLSYKMPTYKAGGRRLHVGVWRHGVSLYGWNQEQAADFLARHPHLKASKGTIQLSPADAAAIPDEEFRAIVRASLND